MKKIIAVDFDLTFADTLTPWFEYCSGSSGSWLKMEDVPDSIGDLVPWFESQGAVNPFSYWTQSDLCDYIKPMENAVNVLNECIDNGYMVIFITHCVPEHEASKRRFVEKWLPRHSAFISTKDKHFVEFDVLIDDNYKVTRKCNEVFKHTITPTTPNFFRINVHGFNYNLPADNEYGQFWNNVSAKFIMRVADKRGI
mgnify:CR=1 FL=1